MPDGNFVGARHAGALVPLFSIPSRASWGIGEIPDLTRFAAWLDRCGLDFILLLPVNEMADGQNSPYSAMSAMAIDPIYIAVHDVEEFAAAGGESSLSDADRAALDEARRSPRVAYDVIREIKSRALGAAFQRFEDTESAAGSPRARAFQDFVERESWWLADYSLFRALCQENGGRYWLEWDEGVRDRQPDAFAAARQRLPPGIRFRAGAQWDPGQQKGGLRANAPPGAPLWGISLLVCRPY